MTLRDTAPAEAPNPPLTAARCQPLIAKEIG